LWREKTGSTGDINQKSSDNDGANFSNTIKVCKNNGTSMTPQIATSGENVYVVWRDDTTGFGDIYLKSSDNAGANYSYTKTVGKTKGPSMMPQIATSGENVYVVWRDDTTGNGDIYFRGSMFAGSDFNKTQKLSIAPSVSSDPKIAASGNNVNVLWREDVAGKGVLNYRVSNDGGFDFSRTQALSGVGMNSSQAQMKASGENVYVVWRDDTTGNGDIYFRVNNIPELKRISQTPEDSSDPNMAIVDGKIYVAWKEGDNVLFRSSADNGISFSDTIALTNSQNESTNRTNGPANNENVILRNLTAAFIQ
jgi:hypothetical protein